MSRRSLGRALGLMLAVGIAAGGMAIAGGALALTARLSLPAEAAAAVWLGTLTAGLAIGVAGSFGILRWWEVRTVRKGRPYVD